jgi:UDP-glucose 4-epimerase
MRLEGKRFLVVGGGGLIGSHVVEALLREDVAEVIVYDNFCRGRIENLVNAQADSRFSVFEHGGDILQTDLLDAAMSEIDGVFHLAALWLLQCQEYPRAAFDVNIQGTFNVIEACVRNKVERLVYSSSSSVYGDAVEEPMPEGHPYNNTTFYGATKIAGEHMCRAFHHRFKMSYVALRYMNVYGPRQDYRGAYIAVIMKMLDRIDRGLSPIVFGDGLQAYDFVHVSDCATANVVAMRSDTLDEFYNVGTGVRTTVLQVAEILIELTGADCQIQFEPEGQSFVTNRVGCPQKAMTDLDFEARVKLRDGLMSLIQWRRATIAAADRSRSTSTKSDSLSVE